MFKILNDRLKRCYFLIVPNDALGKATTDATSHPVPMRKSFFLRNIITEFPGIRWEFVARQELMGGDTVMKTRNIQLIYFR